MTTFAGNIEAKTDEKGRIFIPATYRKVMRDLGTDTLIARRDTENDCIIFYPQQVWNEKVMSLRNALNEWDPQDQLLLMQFVADAEEHELDKMGRTTIKGHAGENMLFVGMLDRFALWNADAFEAQRINQHDLAMQIKERMKKV